MDGGFLDFSYSFAQVACYKEKRLGLVGSFLDLNPDSFTATSRRIATHNDPWLSEMR